MGDLVVSAGVPSLTPLGLRADLSPGTVFLLQLTFTLVRMRLGEILKEDSEDVTR